MGVMRICPGCGAELHEWGGLHRPGCTEPLPANAIPGLNSVAVGYGEPMTETLTRIWCDLDVREDVPDEVGEAGYEPLDVVVDWHSTTLDAEAARLEVQKVLDGGTVNYDLGRGSFLSATLGAELRVEDGTLRRMVICEWTLGGGWAPPATSAPVSVLLAAHHRPSTAFELAAYGELLLALHATAPDHRCPAWCLDCVEEEVCGYAAAATEAEVL